jgi:surface polysaccharide O-acyltransferase-like enzyme
MSAETSLPTLIPAKPKIIYIDHLKIVLTVLVIMHHTFITYGAPGGWYYMQKTTQIGALAPMTMFVAVNQSFFMGFFFFLSALFIPSSYDKKGTSRFITDRLLRLGIPLIFYSVIFSPVLNYLVYYFGYEHHITFLQFLSGYDDWIDFGVLWFVAALLLFTLTYAAWRALLQKQPKTLAAPSFKVILLFAAGTGLISFFIRIVFPVGWTLKPVGFQFAHFTQYIALFILGLVASRNKWLQTIQFNKSIVWTTIILIILFPVLFVFKALYKFPLDWVMGGLHWPALAYALWEQIVGFSIIATLLYIGKKKLNKPSAFLSTLSRSAFAVYIFHPIVIIPLSLAVRNLAIDPALKLLFVAPLAVVLSFVLGSVIVLIPGVRRII